MRTKVHTYLLCVQCYNNVPFYEELIQRPTTKGYARTYGISIVFKTSQRCCRSRDDTTTKRCLLGRSLSLNVSWHLRTK